MVNEMLCYLLNKYGNLTSTHLKQVTLDFYKPRDITKAKEVLSKVLEDCNLDKVPRFPTRRRDSNRDPRCVSSIEYDDIMHMISIMDERQVMDRIPSILVRDVSNLPPVYLKESYYQLFLNRLKKWKI